MIPELRSHGVDSTEELIEERPEESRQCPLEFSTTAMEEERENKGTGSKVRCDNDIVESVPL